MATVGEWFDKNIDDFKKLFAASPGLVSKGQFQLTESAFRAVIKIVRDEINGLPSVPWGVENALDNYKLDGFDNKQRAADLLKLLTHYSNDPEYNKKVRAQFPNTIAAFSPDPGAAAYATNQVNVIWNGDVIAAPPTITNPTADKVLALRKVEKGACGLAATSMARKFLKARGKSITFTTTPFSGTIANAGIHTEKNGRQTVTYNPSVLADQVAKIGDAISRNYVYVVGVTSGLSHDKKVWPDPEHYLLLFAFDGVDRFIFWDSDTQVSDIRSRPQNGPGFGMVRLIDGHFSTARNQADFDDLNAGGMHNADPLRKRYQLFNATPYPQPKRK